MKYAYICKLFTIIIEIYMIFQVSRDQCFPYLRQLLEWECFQVYFTALYHSGKSLGRKFKVSWFSADQKLHGRNTGLNYQYTTLVAFLLRREGSCTQTA